MDNLSHSLVGLAVGELVHRTLPAEADPAHQRTRRRLMLVSCWAASNFPDLDLVLTGLLPQPLGYLLHHRGHTHTLLYEVPQALLLIALLWMLWPGARALLRTSKPARAGLLAAIGAGFLLHLGMDALNSYGVHPLYPFDARWFYGDAVFILEPVFWVAGAVPLAMTLGSRVWRGLLLGTLAAVLGYFTMRGYLHWGSLTALLAFGAVLAMLQQRAGKSGKLALCAALLGGVGFVAIQGAAMQRGKTIVADHLRQLDPASTLLDTAMTAFPTNPACWIFVSAERDAVAGTYRLRRGMVSVAPSVLALDACPAALAEGIRPLKAQLVVNWSEEASLARLRKLQTSNCRFDAWLRFARMPALGPDNASDARFSNTPAGNFTTLPIDHANGQPCPAGAPTWGYPRADLL
ncbi:metal-dependent hydrolase [Massilia pseudoviolaceinigra]|uniref:metal-dependent hydrolase n=1 Tax=Massilia pseudoviolaceinigra TaxID=3057165 RepID=UPI002796BB1E|nr:metal-dependent hydrolase [Massilia sp. CCM 9206]MDQ1921759.1 metal-dependent hydrolase [Massilia sp. CCM 9206]